MFERLLLLVCVLVVSKSVDVQAHVPGNAALSPRLGKASFGVDDRVATLGGLDELRVLFLENGKILLGLPIPDAVSGKEEVHLFKCTLVGLRVQAVDHRKRDDVGDTENVISLLLKSLEDDRKNKREPAVTNRPANDAPSVTLSTDLQWKDLSRIKPWDSEPGSTKGGREEENHSNGTRAVASSESRPSWVLKTGSGETTSKEHRDTLDDRAPVQGPAAADSVQGENTNKSSELEVISTRIVHSVRRKLTIYVMVFNPEIHCTWALGIPAVRKMVGAKIVTPAIPIHSCMIWSQMTN